MKSKHGILIVNLGTPRSFAPTDVKDFLEEFLMDPYVVDIPFLLRYLLVKKIIVPRRYVSSASKYKSVWLPNGFSPLLYHTENLVKAAKEHLADKSIGKLNSNSNIDLTCTETIIEMAMRYGEPSIKSGLELLRLQGVQKITLVPLYPQKCGATTTTTIVEFQKQAKNIFDPAASIELSWIEAFFNDPKYIEIYVEHIKSYICHKSNNTPWDKLTHFVFSFHGLPTRQEKTTSPEYRSQCYETAKLIANGLSLSSNQFSVAFQSRIGRGWMKPFTDETVTDLAKSGKKSLFVISPSFICDCIETIEELGIELKDTFLENGGQEFFLIPSLNDSKPLAARLVELTIS